MARHIQEKLKSLIHEVQHAIQVREGFAVGESPDSKNRNQSAGEIEADDVKARQSMNKEERLAWATKYLQDRIDDLPTAAANWLIQDKYTRGK